MDLARDSRDNAEQRELSVVIPAYNEVKRLTRTLDATASYLEERGCAYEIVVVDDGSTDNTMVCARQWSERFPLRYGLMNAFRYEQNRGKGYAVKYGVLRASGGRILIMDADLATPIEELEKLEAALDADCARLPIAIGSRPIPGSMLVVRQPWYRELAGRMFNCIVQMAATPGIRDTQCGFKLMQRGGAQDLLSRAVLDGFSYDVEVLFLARRLGYKIAEVPVRWSHQEGAAAFPSPIAYLKQGLRMLADLVRIRWAHRMLRQVRGGVVPISASSHPRA